MDRPGVHQVPEGSGEQRKMEETGCEIICGAPTTLAVRGQMMMMMSPQRYWQELRSQEVWESGRLCLTLTVTARMILH